MKNKKYNYILWDWNGTLLDDAAAGVAVINEMLARRKMKTLSGTAEYRRVFCFPVSDYYKKLGFDFERESFEQLSVEYTAAYGRQNPQLRQEAKETLAAVSVLGITQMLLSASEGVFLKKQTKALGVDKFFVKSLSLDNIYAGGKTHLARQWLDDSGTDPKTVLIVGDTLHDLDVAKTLGCGCALICGGHQHLDRSNTHGAKVLNSLCGVLKML